MDFLSPTQLRSYESIISKIQVGHEKSQKLKQEIEKANNNLIISKLSQAKICQKLGHVNVKIFSDLVELFNLYCEDITDNIQDLIKHKNCKFYMIEIFITNSLQKHLKDMKWSLLISIKNQLHELLCKNISMEDHIKTPIIAIIPVDQRIIDCEVSASIVLQTHENLTYVSLDKVNVNISYHFQMIRKTKTLSKERQIIEMSKCYNSENLIEIHKPLLVEYKFLTKINSKEFLKLFIKNCYHNVDLEHFSELGANESKKDFNLKFSTGSAKHSITFNKELKLISLKSNIFDMAKLKNYFWNENTLEISDGKEMKKRLMDLIAMLQQYSNKDELCNFYFSLRNIWTK